MGAPDRRERGGIYRRPACWPLTAADRHFRATPGLHARRPYESRRPSPTDWTRECLQDLYVPPVKALPYTVDGMQMKEGQDPPGPSSNSIARRRLAVAAEMHEASVLAVCFDAAAAVSGNPLGVIVDHSVTPPLMVAQAVASAEINRIVGMGVSSPATRESVSAAVDFFSTSGQSAFRIELSPVASPASLAKDLETEGLRSLDYTITKWAMPSIDDVPRPPDDVEVRLLGPEHRDAVAELNVTAWGAWDAVEPLRAWFGSIVGTPPFHHYGVFDGDRLVVVQALAIAGALGWMGFAATHPRHRGNNLSRIVSSQLIAQARELGCRVLHSEGDTRYRSSRKPTWEVLYERTLYSPAP